MSVEASACFVVVVFVFAGLEGEGDVCADEAVDRGDTDEFPEFVCLLDEEDVDDVEEVEFTNTLLGF